MQKNIYSILILFIILICNSKLMSQNATNPFIYADVPDIAIVRVGGTYYMSSTTMHVNPGVPIMKSTDLVNWDLVNYCYSTLSTSDGYSLNNGKTEYGHGSWASSIRYFKGNYYVSTFANTGKTYIYKTANIETGPWTVSVLNSSYHDCNLFFDDDDRVYLIYGQGEIKIIELTADATAIKSGGLNKTLISNAGAVAGPIGLNAEGSQVVKYNGYYFINNICWPSGGMRTQIVHRSSTLAGTYESKVILKDQGVAQGSFISTPAGKWYAYLFKDNGAVGRVPCLVPMTWVNDWPVLSAVPSTLDIPKGVGGMHNIVSSDEFSVASPLKLAWQWNHNPVNASWSMSTAKTGVLRISNERTDPNALMTTNTLTQRSFGPKCSAYTSIDVSGMKDGDYTGMIALQKQYGYVGVKMAGTTKTIVMVTGDDVTGTPSEKASVPLNQTTVYVRVDMDFTNRTDKATFYYSLNGTTWTSIGSTLSMSYTIPHFMGYRFGLFNYATKSTGGYADFDFFRIGANITEAQNSVNNAPAVSITTSANNTTFTAPASINLTATATVSGGTISKVEFYNGTTKLGEDATTPYTYAWTNVAAGSYTITSVATDNTGIKTTSPAITIKVNVPQGAYNGIVHPIPGTIQAEEYDLGGNGIAYSDDTPGSEVSPVVNFRTTEDVDIETCTDAGGGYNIGYATAGEWLEYTTNVASSSNYNIDLRVACSGDSRTLSLTMDGVSIANNIAIPNTSGWQNWQTVTLKDVPLTAGQHVLRMTIGATSYVNINFLTFTSIITDTKEITFQDGITIYPNPFENIIEFKNVGNYEYELYDLAGKLLFKGFGIDKIEFPDTLQSGLYMLNLKLATGNQLFKIQKK